MLSIGGNDMGFAQALQSLTKETSSWWDFFTVLNLFAPPLAFAKAYASKGVHSPGEVQARVLEQLRDGSEFSRSLEQLAHRINSELRPRAVMVVEYPTALFDGDDERPQAGCGLFDVPSLGLSLSEAEAALVEAVGNALNARLEEWCEKHTYRYVGGIARAFKGHGYCSSDSYWRAAEGTVRKQLDKEGVLHPDAGGHTVIADIIGPVLAQEMGRLRRPARG